VALRQIAERSGRTTKRLTAKYSAIVAIQAMLKERPVSVSQQTLEPMWQLAKVVDHGKARQSEGQEER